MKVSKENTVLDIQKQFNNIFPFLKIEFYSEKHEANLGSPLSKQLVESVKLSDINPTLKAFEVSLNPEMSVSAFEQDMHDKGSLYVQVFRKSAGIWLQTTSTDHWTLEKQNGKGERSTTQDDIEPIHVTDFDLE